MYKINSLQPAIYFFARKTQYVMIDICILFTLVYLAQQYLEMSIVYVSLFFYFSFTRLLYILLYLFVYLFIYLFVITLFLINVSKQIPVFHPANFIAY